MNADGSNLINLTNNAAADSHPSWSPDGTKIVFYTARGMGRFDGDGQKAHEAFYDLTYNQLKSWGCKFDKLHMGKFHAHYFIDDKGINSEDFFG